MQNVAHSIGKKIGIYPSELSKLKILITLHDIVFPPAHSNRKLPVLPDHQLPNIMAMRTHWEEKKTPDHRSPNQTSRDLVAKTMIIVSEYQHQWTERTQPFVLTGTEPSDAPSAWVT